MFVCTYQYQLINYSGLVFLKVSIPVHKNWIDVLFDHKERVRTTFSKLSVRRTPSLGSASCVRSKKVRLRVAFKYRVIFYVRTSVKFTFANKIAGEAMHERSFVHVSVKIEPRSTSRLSSALFILPLFYLCD